MPGLPNEMLQAIMAETVDTMPEGLLAYYRNPPGRRPHASVKRIQGAIADMADADAKELIRDVVDRTLFQMLYLIDSAYKDLGIETAIRRGAQSCELGDSGLHEAYRQQVHPGGTRVTE